MTSTEASAEALIAAAEDTHGSTIRIAPPLMIGEEDLDWGRPNCGRCWGSRAVPVPGISRDR